MDTIIVANIIGLAAAVLTSLQHPSHVVYLWGHKDEPPVLRGLSTVSILTTTANSLLWVIYGVSYNAIPTALASAGAIAVMGITVWLLCRARVWSPTATAAYVVFAAACVVWPMLVSQSVLGFIGTAISVVTWLPAAVKTVRTRGTFAGLAYPPTTSWIIIANNVLWIIYGVMLNDVWLWAACPAGIASACVMLWTYRSSQRTLRAQGTAVS